MNEDASLGCLPALFLKNKYPGDTTICPRACFPTTHMNFVETVSIGAVGLADFRGEKDRKLLFSE